MPLYICPELDGLDPTAKDFDGGGHKVALGPPQAPPPGGCKTVYGEGTKEELEQGCERDLIEVTDPDQLAKWHHALGLALPEGPAAAPSEEEIDRIAFEQGKETTARLERRRERFEKWTAEQAAEQNGP